MKIDTICTTYSLHIDSKHHAVLSRNKKLIWQFRKAVYSSVRMHDVCIMPDYRLNFMLFAEDDNSQNHNKIMATAQQFFEDNG